MRSAGHCRSQEVLRTDSIDGKVSVSDTLFFEERTLYFVRGWEARVNTFGIMPSLLKGVANESVLKNSLFRNPQAGFLTHKINNHAQRTWYCFSPLEGGGKLAPRGGKLELSPWHCLKFESELFLSTFVVFLVSYILLYHFGIQANGINTITWHPKMITPIGFFL